jgi:hypothetical protein
MRTTCRIPGGETREIHGWYSAGSPIPPARLCHGSYNQEEDFAFTRPDMITEKKSQTGSINDCVLKNLKKHAEKV